MIRSSASRTATRALSARRIASAPCSFGVDEVVADDAWVPGPTASLEKLLDAQRLAKKEARAGKGKAQRISGDPAS